MRFMATTRAGATTLPVLDLARDRKVTLPVAAAGTPATRTTTRAEIPTWQRWNDYGIGLLRKPGTDAAAPGRGGLPQVVEALGSAHGPLNLARVYLREGRIAEEAPAALRRARDAIPRAAYEWSVLWFSGLVNQQNGNLDAAIDQRVPGRSSPAASPRHAGRGLRLPQGLQRAQPPRPARCSSRAKQERGRQPCRQKQRDAAAPARRGASYGGVLAIDPRTSPPTTTWP